MPDISQIHDFKLKVIFLVHFVFTSLASMGHWSSTGYLFYNSVLILLLIISLYDSSQEPLQLAIVVNGVAVILDILLLVMGFPSSDYRARERFSAALAILHLIVRPFSTIVMGKQLEERTGSRGILSGIMPSARNESYEDIDRPTVPNPGPTAGYDFSSAQPI